MEELELEELVVKTMVEHNVEKNSIVGVMLMLKTEKQQQEILDYMNDNPKADQTAILNEAVEMFYRDGGESD